LEKKFNNPGTRLSLLFGIFQARKPNTKKNISKIKETGIAKPNVCLVENLKIIAGINNKAAGIEVINHENPNFNVALLFESVFNMLIWKYPSTEYFCPHDEKYSFNWDKTENA
jgi:hypothetical protein